MQTPPRVFQDHFFSKQQHITKTKVMELSKMDRKERKAYFIEITEYVKDVGGISYKKQSQELKTVIKSFNEGKMKNYRHQDNTAHPSVEIIKQFRNLYEKELKNFKSSLGEPSEQELLNESFEERIRKLEGKTKIHIDQLLAKISELTDKLNKDN